jgi:uncharacterized protein HemY
MTDRISQLEQSFANNPEDPFLIYALGVEYKNANNFEKAAEYFELAIKKFSDYVPTYLQYGMLLADLDKSEEAKAILDVGIQKANKVGNAHAASEMLGVLDSLN